MRIEREAVRHVPDSLSFDSCRPRSGLPPSRQVLFLKDCRASSSGLSERAETTGHRAFRSKTQAAKSQDRNAIPPLRATVPARRFNFVPGPSVPAGNDDCTAIRQSEPSRQAGRKAEHRFGLRPTGKREKNGYDKPTSPEDCRGEKRMKEIRASCLLRNDPYSGNTARSAGSDVSDRPHAAAAISPERTESTVRVFRYLCGRQRG